MLKKWVRLLRLKMIDRKYYGSGIGLMLVNYINKYLIQRYKGDFLMHFTSRVNFSDRIVIGASTENIGSYISLNISTGCYYQAYNGINIGVGTIWAPGCHFISANHSFLDLKKSEPASPINIGVNVWIGANCVILPSVELGNNCIVGAGSVVTKSFPPYCIIAGSPAKIIAMRCERCLAKKNLMEPACGNCEE